MSEGGAAEAEKIFKAALAKHRAGDLQAALNGYRRVIAVAPAHGPAHQNLAVVLRRLNQPEEALAMADAAVGLIPAEPGAHVTRGRALMDLARPQEALASFERAVALAPQDPVNQQNRATALLALRRPAEALDALDLALSIVPDGRQLLLDRGVALSALDRGEEATAAFARAAELEPTLAVAHRNLAIGLRKLGRLDEALDRLDGALARRPDDAGLHNLRANTLVGLQRHEAALESYDRALALQPDLVQAHNGRGTALAAMERLEAALAAYERALELDPQLAVAHRNRGVILRKLRRPQEALAAQDRAIALEPGNPDAYWFRGLCHLLLREFEAGWRDYERRWEVDEFVQTASSHMTPALRARLSPLQSPLDVAGRDVLVVGEQGIGDVVMFASALPDLMAVAGRVALVCDPRLRRLFRGSFPDLELLDAAAAARGAEAFQVVMGVGTLGRLFRNRPEDFPGVAYLDPPPDGVAKWADRLGPAAGRRRVGISWRGGSVRTGGAARSLDLARLRPVLDLPGCEFVSLQYGDVADDLAAANADLDSPIRVFPSAAIDDFADLAGLIRNLDLIVSVQTSLVHLTGALGAPGLVMVPATPEWRYAAAGPTIPWYRSIQLFRQDEEGDWSRVVRDVAAEAAARLGLER